MEKHTDVGYRTAVVFSAKDKVFVLGRTSDKRYLQGKNSVVGCFFSVCAFTNSKNEVAN